MRSSKPLEAELVVILASGAQTLSKVDALPAGGANRRHLQKMRKKSQSNKEKKVFLKRIIDG